MPEHTHGSNLGGKVPVIAPQSPGQTAPHSEGPAPPRIGEPAAPAVSATGPAYPLRNGTDFDRNGCRHFTFGENRRVIGVGTTLCERFTLVNELGHGGMGTVYRATDQLLGRNVAIKFLKDSRTKGEADQIRLEAQ